MPYTQMKTAPAATRVVATEDVFLVLEDGRRLIDGMASWWTACHGYNHPRIAAAVRDQLDAMPHVMFGGITHPPARELARRLAAMCPGTLQHVFLSDSGSVSVEVALKIAVQFWLNQGIRGRNRFVCFQNAYHGDTTGAMSVCDPVNSMHAHFKGFLLEQFPARIPRTQQEADEFEGFLRDHEAQLAGVIIEPLIQGAGGMKFHPPEALRHVATACERVGTLFIADEIATGFGRTGSTFACEQADVVPDIMCLGKALTGGTIGMAATVATDRVFDRFLSDDPQHALMHGPTFMANPLACAAANASLDLFEREPRLAQVAEIEAQMREALAECASLPGIVDVRVKGAVGVVQVEELYELDRLRAEFVEAGVWLRPFGDMIYLTPPLTIGPHLNTLLSATTHVIHNWSSWT